MNNKLKIATALSAAAVALVCVSGITIAVNTADNSQQGTVTTAGLGLNATASGLRVYSAVADADAAEGYFTDEHGNKYVYAQQTASGDDGSLYFGGGGSVACTGDTVTISNMLAGDKVEFDIDVTSTSTIAFNYRAELYVDASEGEALLDALEFDAGELSLYRRDGIDTSDAALAELSAFMTDYTEWSAFAGNQAAIERVHITVALPMTADLDGDQTVKIKYVASGVQNPESMPDVAEVGEGDAAAKFKTLGDAADYAGENGIDEIKVIGSTVVEEGAVTISRATKFVGVRTDGKLPEIKGARIAVIDGAAVAFDGIAFTGASYIDVTGSTAVTVKDCDVKVDAVRFFDKSARSYLSDPAFVVSGTSVADVRVDMTGNTVKPDGGAAMCMRTLLTDGSTIENNTFGESGKIYAGTAAIVLEGAKNGATVKLANNTLYAKLPVSLGTVGNGNRFRLVSSDNTAIGGDGLFIGGVSDGAALDFGSEIGSGADALRDVTVADMGEGLLFCGASVAYDDNMSRVKSGSFALYNINDGDFYTYYVTVGTLAKNAIVICENGEPHAYLNSAAGDKGYVLDLI